jgi:hypothetical protein
MTADGHEPQIRVTVEDLATGETETTEVCDDYVLLTAGSCYVDGIQTYPTKGTHVLTIKGRR